MIQNPKILRLDDIARDPLPPIDWLVKGVMVWGDKVVLSGDFGSFKSWATLHLAFHLALGRTWLGFEVPQARKVLYVDEEMSDWEVRRRLKRMMEMEGVSLGHPLLHDNLIAISRSSFVARPIEFAVLKGICGQERFSPEVVIMETLARIMEGNENLVGDVAAFWRHVTQYLQDERRTVLVTHHMNKPGMDDTRQLRHRIRGSTDIPAGGDTIIALEAHGDPPEYSRVVPVKTRGGKPFRSFAIELVEKDPMDPENTPITVQRLQKVEGGEGKVGDDDFRRPVQCDGGGGD